MYYKFNKCYYIYIYIYNKISKIVESNMYEL